jgi:tripartite-type tricarboxylate transporter receptor subunit TctC
MRFVLVIAFALLPLVATAQPYPSKPVRIIVNFPAGGVADIYARIIGAKVQESWGQPVVVENRTGGGGNIGADAVAKSAPDGYTLNMSAIGPHAVNVSLFSKMPYDPVKDFAAIALVLEAEGLLVVHPTVPANNIAELIAYARANPGKLTFASAGPGTASHLAGELFKTMAKVDMLHIPYKGNVPAITDLLAGQTNMMFDNIPSALPHIKSGRLIALATTGAKRDPALPDVPTIAEAGVANYESGVWFGIMVPTGTPHDIIMKLNSAAVQATKSPEFIKRMTDLGYSIIPGSPEDMTRMLKAEVARWTPIVKASGAKVD